MQHFYCSGCQVFTREQLMDRKTTADPYCTGDYHVTETQVRCPECHGDDVEEMAPCEGCATNVPLEGMDDCAHCIMGDKYSHTTNYDAGDHEMARRWLAANCPEDLATVEDVGDRARERHLQKRSERVYP